MPKTRNARSASALKRILVATYGEAGYSRDIVIGVSRYAAEVGNWYVSYAIESQWPVEVPWEGVLGCFGWRTNRDKVTELLRCSQRLVSVAQFLNDVPELPFVGQDNEAIGRMAAEHFIERGFRHFAMLQDAEYWSTLLRTKGFRDRLARDGFAVQVSKAGWRDWRYPDTGAGEQGRWLASLPKPCALFCNSDGMSWQATISCHAAGISVPDEIAVLGVDDNELYTRSITPSLSSVRTHSEKIGYEGAKLLHRLMQGAPAPTEPRFIEPERVAMRASTDVIAIDDAALKQAVRYMREHACEGVNVEDVLRETALSRRSLEVKMRRAFGRTPQQELARIRIGRARELLVASELKLADVARQAGFGSLERFATVFKSSVGMRPTAFRRRYRRPAGWDVDMAAAPWRKRGVLDDPQT